MLMRNRMKSRNRMYLWLLPSCSCGCMVWTKRKNDKKKGLCKLIVARVQHTYQGHLWNIDLVNVTTWLLKKMWADLFWSCSCEGSKWNNDSLYKLKTVIKYKSGWKRYMAHPTIFKVQHNESFHHIDHFNVPPKIQLSKFKTVIVYYENKCWSSSNDFVFVSGR